MDALNLQGVRHTKVLRIPRAQALGSPKVSKFKLAFLDYIAVF
jgi:hypothetical protein